MSDQITIAREVLELVDTIRDGLEHLEKRMAEGHFEDTEYLFTDILTAATAIFRASQPFITENDQEIMDRLKEKLLMALDGMSANYEQKKLSVARMDLQFVLIPAYQVWQAEIHKCLSPWLE